MDIQATDSTANRAANAARASLTVCELGDMSGGNALVPSDCRERAQALLWEEFADTVLNSFVVAAR